MSASPIERSELNTTILLSVERVFASRGCAHGCARMSGFSLEGGGTDGIAALICAGLSGADDLLVFARSVGQSSDDACSSSLSASARVPTCTRRLPDRARLRRTPWQSPSRPYARIAAACERSLLLKR